MNKWLKSINEVNLQPIEMSNSLPPRSVFIWTFDKNKSRNKKKKRRLLFSVSLMNKKQKSIENV